MNKNLLCKRTSKVKGLTAGKKYRFAYPKNPIAQDFINKFNGQRTQLAWVINDRGVSVKVNIKKFTIKKGTKTSDQTKKNKVNFSLTKKEENLIKDGKFSAAVSEHSFRTKKTIFESTDICNKFRDKLLKK